MAAGAFHEAEPSGKVSAANGALIQSSRSRKKGYIHVVPPTKRIVLKQILGLICCLCVCPRAAIHRGDLRQLEGQNLPEVHREVRQRSWRVGALAGTVRKHITKSTFSLSPPPPPPQSDKFTRFCQWKNVELNIHVSAHFCVCVCVRVSVH